MAHLLGRLWILHLHRDIRQCVRASIPVFHLTIGFLITLTLLSSPPRGTSSILYWFPFYYTIKTFVVLYLMLPQTQGAKVVYSRILRPMFVNAKKTADSAAAPSAQPTVQPTAAGSDFH